MILAGKRRVLYIFLLREVDFLFLIQADPMSMRFLISIFFDMESLVLIAHPLLCHIRVSQAVSSSSFFVNSSILSL